MRCSKNYENEHVGRGRSCFVVGVLCALLCVGVEADAQARSQVASAVDQDRAREEMTGPTIQLNYSRETFESNPISSFMYFVPLISRTPVDRETSAENEQEVGIVSYERNVEGDSFSVVCEFEIRGTGFHRNTFEPVAGIASRVEGLREGETVEGVLDFVMFEGEGLGRIEVTGRIDDDVATVTDVDFRFNLGGESPVTVGLYDVKPVDGRYTYENRSSEVVARVNTLSFTHSNVDPTMGIKVDTVRKPGSGEGFFARLKGVVANLSITPPKIDPLGNETMMRLGDAVAHKRSEFTFPVAVNLEHDERAELKRD